MVKRQASGPKPGRKKRRGNATYESSSLDVTLEDKTSVENIRTWNLSTLETTGRVRGTRRTHKHYNQDTPEMNEGSGGAEETPNLEDAGNLADSEAPPEVVDKQHRKRTRVRVIKENDSVSVNYRSHFLGSLVLPD